MAARASPTKTAAVGFIVGRSMDWGDDPHSDLYVFPAGMKRDGGIGENSLEWTSKYGSLIVSFYDIATVDGMNEAGLVGNHLYLAEADYGDPAANAKPAMSIGAELQYLLDNFATVADAVQAMQDPAYHVVAPKLPNGRAASAHIALTDATGDNAIFEWIDGELVIHHSADYRVMTNSPPFDEQLAIDAYWQEIGGMTFLPGTYRAADRFVRTSFNLAVAPKHTDPRLAASTVFSIIRSASVPLGISDPEAPNISTTLWRTVSDIPRMRYYFESAYSPNVFWIDFEKLDLSPGAPSCGSISRGTRSSMARRRPRSSPPSRSSGFLPRPAPPL